MLDTPILPAPYPRQLEDHFIRLGEELRQAREQAGRGRPAEATRALLRALLGLPTAAQFAARAPLPVQVTGVLQRDGYRLEKVVYESRPGFHVTGALYLPDLPYPVPGVLCPHGHHPEGRYSPTVQARCVGLARRGYVALSIDKVGYQERTPQEHRTRAGLLAGLTTQGVQVYDNQRGLDLLAARPEVLPDRLGCTGASGGGNQTMYVSAIDTRITASVPVCSVEMGESYLHKRFCTCELVPRLLQHLDLPDICGLIAPRALLLIHGLLDSGFRIDSARKAEQAIRTQYEAAGCPGQLAHFTSYDPHGYTAPMRAAMYDFFDRHLKGLATPGAVPNEEPAEAPDDLRGLPGGLPEGHQTLVSLARQKLADDAADPATAGGWVADLPGNLTPATWPQLRQRWQEVADRAVLNWPRTVTPLAAETFSEEVAEVGGRPYVVRRLLYRSEPDVVVPALWVGHRTLDPGLPARVWVGPDGHRGVAWDEVVEAVGDGERTVLLIDPRGTGETRSPDPHNESQAYLSSVTLGRPVAVMRAWDIRRAADFLADAPTLELRVDGGLDNGLAGLLAAAWEPRFASVEIATLLAGYRDEDEFGDVGTAGQSAILPGLLAAGLDIGRLLALVAPRRVRVGEFVDGLGRTTPRRPGDLDDARRVARLLGAETHLELP